MVTDASKERIAAALALAEALEPAYEHNHAEGYEMRLGPNMRAKLMAYRATLPKLRTRAEVDAEIVATIRGGEFWNVRRKYGFKSVELDRLCDLCAEPTTEPNALTDHDADERPCSCDEALSLREKLQHIETECELYFRGRKPASSALAAIREQFR